jgi:DNA invertase Pin-like site-specific DNA recombinase
MRMIGYVRIGPRERHSTRPELDEQRKTIRRECDRRGWSLVGIEEDVRSGRSTHRPALEAALAACRAGDADGVVVARLDRLTYSLDHLALLVREASAREFNIVAVDLGIDLATKEGRHLAAVLSTTAGWTPRAFSLRARHALAERRDGSARRRGRPPSTPHAVAARIRSWRASGWTLQAICDALNAEGVPTPRGGALWRPTSLRAVLRPVGRHGTDDSAGR